MKNAARLQQRLRESDERCESLQRENESLQSQIASLRAEFATFRRDYEALAETTRAVVGERDLLKNRVAELEVANKRLVDMLWGRRSERRSDSPDQMQLAVDSPYLLDLLPDRWASAHPASVPGLSRTLGSLGWRGKGVYDSF